MSIPFLKVAVPPPPLYVEFIERGKRYFAERGIPWGDVITENSETGRKSGLDIRKLVRSREEHASYMNHYEVDERFRAEVLAAGRALHLTPRGSILCEDVQDFLKAMVALKARESMAPRQIRARITELRAIFSVYGRRPWELSSEDMAMLSVQNVTEHFRVALRAFARDVNSHGLTVNGPLVASSPSKQPEHILENLEARPSAEKLPAEAALYELFRIVYQEAPEGHNDILKFAMVRILYLTGLRYWEVAWLPVDCLQWTDHSDFVTGRPAGEVGGVSRTLRLRYFGVKRADGRPDLLVEDYQPVPQKFQALIADTVAWVQEQTSELRHVLARQRLERDQYEGTSSLNVFATNTGDLVGYEDLLFLTIRNLNGHLPAPIPMDASISKLSRATFYDFLGVNQGHAHLSGFARFGILSPDVVAKVKPHSLRHLLNTELFRQGVADTIITKLFGRTSVAQSYVYDHRSLAEKLQAIELPPNAYKVVIPGSAAEAVAKGVVSGLFANSPIVRTFLKIQVEQGDDIAFAYLVTHADGFHVTPYGFCVNSFSMNPCPKHLQCFNNCNQFAPSGMQEHTFSLQKLRERLQAARGKAGEKPVNSPGRKNQIADADMKIRGVEMALLGAPGVPIFPDGVNRSLPPKDIFS